MSQENIQHSKEDMVFIYLLEEEKINLSRASEEIQKKITEAKQLKDKLSVLCNKRGDLSTTSPFEEKIRELGQRISELENLHSSFISLNTLNPKTIPTSDLLRQCDLFNEQSTNLSQQKKEIEEKFQALKSSLTSIPQEMDGHSDEVKNLDSSKDVENSDNSEDMEDNSNNREEVKVISKKKHEKTDLSGPTIEQYVELEYKNQCEHDKRKEVEQKLNGSIRDKKKIEDKLLKVEEENERLRVEKEEQGKKLTETEKKLLKTTKQLINTNEKLHQEKGKRKSVIGHFSNHEENSKATTTTSDQKDEIAELQIKLELEIDKRKEQTKELVQVKKKLRELEESIIQKSYSSIGVYYEEDFQVKDKGIPIPKDLLEEQMPVNFENPKIALERQITEQSNEIQKSPNEQITQQDQINSHNELIRSYTEESKKIESIRNSLGSLKQVFDESESLPNPMPQSGSNSNISLIDTEDRLEKVIGLIKESNINSKLSEEKLQSNTNILGQTNGKVSNLEKNQKETQEKLTSLGETLNNLQEKIETLRSKVSSEQKDLSEEFKKNIENTKEDFNHVLKGDIEIIQSRINTTNDSINGQIDKIKEEVSDLQNNFNSQDFNTKINGFEKLCIDTTNELKAINEENQTKLTQEIKEFQRQQNVSNEQFKDELNVHSMNYQNLTHEQTTFKEDLNKLKKEYHEQLTALTNEFSIQLKSKEKEIEDLSNKLEEALKSTNEGQKNLKQQISMLLKEKQTLLSEFSNLQKIYNEQIKLLNEKIEHEVEIFKNTHQDLPTIEQISKFSEELNQKILVSQKEISDKIEDYHVNQSNELKEILNKLDESNKEQIELKNTLIKIEDSNKHLIPDLQKNTEEKNLLKQDLEEQIQVLKNQQQIDGLAIGQINGFISEHNHKFDENNTKLNDLSTQFNKLEENQNNNLQELTNLKKDLGQIRNKSGEQTTLNNELLQKIKLLENQVVSLHTELGDLKNLNHQNQCESIQKTNDLIKKNEDLQVQLSALKKEYLEESEKEIKKLQDQLNEQTQEQEKLKKENELRINSLKNQNEEDSVRINQLQEQQEKSSNKFLELQKQHEDEISLINEQARKLDDLSKKLERQEEKFQNEIKQLKEEQIKLKGKNRQSKQIKEILNEPKKEVDQKQNVLLLENEIDQKKVNYKLEKKVQFIEKELFEQQKELHQKELKDVKKQNKILQKQLDDLHEKQDEREPRNSKRRSSSLSPSNRGFDYKTVLEELGDEKPSHTTKVETSRKNEEKQPNISVSRQPHMALKVNGKLIDICTINPDKMNIVKDEYNNYKNHISNGKNSLFQSVYNPQVFPFDRFEVFKQSPFYIEGKHTSRNFPHQITVYKINSLENALRFTKQLERQKALPEGIFKKVSDETQSEQFQKKGAKSPYEQDIVPEKGQKDCKI